MVARPPLYLGKERKVHVKLWVGNNAIIFVVYFCTGMKLLHRTNWEGNTIRPGNDPHVGHGYIWTYFVEENPCCKKHGKRVLEISGIDLSQFSEKWNFYFVNKRKSIHTFCMFDTNSWFPYKPFPC